MRDRARLKRALWRVPIALFILATDCTSVAPPVIAQSANYVIVNTGSTNTFGYRVVITTDARAIFASGDGSGAATLPPALFDRLRSDVSAAAPLSRLAVPPTCVKSASFGSSTYLALDDDRSPDLSCPAAGAAGALEQDIAAIVTFLKIRNVVRGQGQGLPQPRP